MSHRILVVDDDAPIADFLQTFLEQKGYHVSVAYDGESAIAAMESDLRPQLVLMDIIMPKLDGITALTRLLKINPELPVIMITGIHDVEAGKRAMEVGAADYITKPLDLEYLERSVVAKLQALLDQTIL